MRYKIGFNDETLGEVWLDGARIAVQGDEDALHKLLELIRNNGESDAALMARLPQVLDSPYAWAVPAEEAGA